MKIAKYIFLLILLFSIAFIVFIATQPSEFDVKSEKTIAISKSKLFQFVNDYKNWDLWYPSLKENSKVKTSISEISSGEGSFIKWEDTMFTTTQIFEQDSIYQLEKVSDQEYARYWSFKENKNGTTVTWGIKGKMNFKEKLNSFLDGSSESYFISKIEEGLENINNYLVNEVNNYNILVNGIVTRPESFYIQQKDSCKVAEYNLCSLALIEKINKFVKQNDIRATGDTFIQILDENSNGYIKFMASVPIEEEILTTPLSDVKGHYLEEYSAIKVTLRGDLSHKKEAVNKAIDYLKESDEERDESLPVIEIYKNTDKSKIIKPSEKTTEILIPLKSKIVKPTVVPTPISLPKQKIVKKVDSIR